MAGSIFAKKEMNRCGWSEGKGLGREEDGTKDAIKVKVKNNKSGLGHDQGAEFTFHWWDHIFNKAANSFKVSESEDGAIIEQCKGKKITPVLISNRKPLSSKFANKSLLYGTFVKSGTYHDDKELSNSLTDICSSGESSDDETLLLNDTLNKTFKKTGLTGHKAARHGFNLSGKLQRIKNQEEKQSPASLEYSKVNEVDEEKDNKDVCSNVMLKRKKRSNEHVEDNKSYSKLDKNDETKESDIQICNSDNPKKKKKKKKKKKDGKDGSIEKLDEIEKPVSKLTNCIHEVTSKVRKGKHMLKGVSVLEN